MEKEIKKNIPENRKKDNLENIKKEKEAIKTETKKDLKKIKDEFEKRKEILKYKDEVWEKIENLLSQVKSMNIPEPLKNKLNEKDLKTKFDKYINQIDDINTMEKALKGINQIALKITNLLNKLKSNPKDKSMLEDSKNILENLKKQYKENIGFINLDNANIVDKRGVAYMLELILAGISIAAGIEWLIAISMTAFILTSVWILISLPEKNHLIIDTLNNYILDIIDDKIDNKYIDKKDFEKLRYWARNKYIYYEWAANLYIPDDIINWNVEKKIKKCIKNFTSTNWQIDSSKKFSKFVEYIIKSC